ncbi:hypothetical protein N7456_001048 [Penicillium angulare]|uniref:Zn(2)-C6 fungal-type domain-containing protein n=1 Tax=Penicillium angulare TaxID=116970 RepID=A0A9W9GDL4_9EURO|nr:hypothetical protein N7456_001048 [Penicillium angulare]
MPTKTRGRPARKVSSPTAEILVAILTDISQVKCSKPTGPCDGCIRMGLDCPGLSEEKLSSAELRARVNNAFRHAGRRRRVVGACHECQAAKLRCDRGKPRCQRCELRSLPCLYSDDRDQRYSDENASSSKAVSVSPPVRGINDPIEGPDISSFTENIRSADHINDAPSGLPLPDDLQEMRRLVDAYFVHIHPLRCLSFVHKPSFMQSLDQGRMKEDFGEALVHIICAFGSRFINNSPRTEDWAGRAQEMAFLNISTPSISNLMALVLLCEWHMRFGQESTAFMISGICSRLAQLLRLDSEATIESLEGIPSGLLVAEKEARRRLVWSCYNLDVAISSGVDLISNWPSAPRTKLPCSDREFTLQLKCETGMLCEGDSFADELAKTPNMCLEAYFVHIMYLRKQVLRLIRESGPGSLSKLDVLTTNLEKCGESLPRHLQLNEMNAYIHEESNQLPAFYALHLLYHQCFCDLYRVALPGYQFPLSAVIEKNRPGVEQHMQFQCAEHAKAITNILKMNLQRRKKPLVDSSCAICAYESSKIQIVYARTSMGLGQDVVKQNIATNLEALDLMFPWDKKRDMLISSLSKLLHEFGFSELADQWFIRNNKRQVMQTTNRE